MSSIWPHEPVKLFSDISKRLLLTRVGSVTLLNSIFHPLTKPILLQELHEVEKVNQVEGHNLDFQVHVNEWQSVTKCLCQGKKRKKKREREMLHVHLNATHLDLVSKPVVFSLWHTMRHFYTEKEKKYFRSHCFSLLIRLFFLLLATSIPSFLFPSFSRSSFDSSLKQKHRIETV